MEISQCSSSGFFLSMLPLNCCLFVVIKKLNGNDAAKKIATVNGLFVCFDFY